MFLKILNVLTTTESSINHIAVQIEILQKRKKYDFRYKNVKEAG